ncbi:hypothetical protein [Curtobacterium oceanosedimentum]|uniref:hypothetical protein n=1 Tax=Curtobacterium oceanosedimentum TaxID=465820 RepID=UPI00128EB0C3|nr:hypothetical protein [Curtobacterium oceanosedimentum]
MTPGSFNQVSDTVRRRSPAVLVVLNAGRSAGLGPLVSYWETATGRRARHVHADGFSEMLEGLREELADLVGVTDTLYRLPARVESGPVPDRVPAFPVARTDKCYVDGTGRHYARDPETELWWTKDTKGDGGTVFKTYRRDNGQLLFEADRSADGGVIPKHKGPTGEKIDLNDLGGCAHPERHANKALL